MRSVRRLIRNCRPTLVSCSGRVYTRVEIELEMVKVFELCLSSPQSREKIFEHRTVFDVYFELDSIHCTTTVGVYNSPKIVCRGGYHGFTLGACGPSIVAYTVFYCVV